MLEINNEGSRLPHSYSIKKDNNTYKLYTVGDLLNVLEYSYMNSENLSDMFIEDVLNYGTDEEIWYLYQIQEKAYDRYWKGDDNWIIGTKYNIILDKDELIKQYYWYWNYYFFLKKDFNMLKWKSSEQYTVSASHWSSTYWQKIDVVMLELYIPSKKQLILYTWRIKVFSDKNNLGYSPLSLLD